MSWVITPTFSISYLHLEAQNWSSRVIANGGTASLFTLTAVSAFCDAIDAQSGLRSAITRLNLFCGDSLNACLVPLYLAESFGAAAKGNTTDTNNGPFGSGDYVESGASGGLTGNDTTKYLDTGLPQNAVATSSSHLSVSGTGFSNTKEDVSVGAYNGAETNIHDLTHRVPTSVVDGNIRCQHRCGSFVAANAQTADIRTSEIHLIGSRTSASAAALYRAGTLVASSTQSNSSASYVSNRSYFVFALNNVGSANPLTAARLRMYSIGSGLTASQASAFSTAVNTFNIALGRN